MVTFWGGVGFLAGELSGTTRKASGAVIALLFGTYLLNNIFNTIPSLGGFGWFMPFRYYSESKPLVPGETFEWVNWLVLVILTTLTIACATLLFTRRDLGAPFPLLSRRADRTARSGEHGTGTEGTESTTHQSSPVLLSSVFGKSLRDLSGLTIAWSLGLSLYAVVIISTANQVLEPMIEIARSGGLIGALLGEIASTEGFLAVALFINLPLFATIYSIVQIESWASEEEEGHLGMLLAMPVPREQVLIARYAATLLGLLTILIITGIAIVLSAWAADVALDSARVWGGLFALIPVVMLVSAFGLCAATWLPRPSIAVPITIAIVAAMFLLEVFGTLFRWPEEIRNLSIFHLYGRPLLEGIKWAAFTALTLATLLFAASSFVGFRRRDLTA
jgi:ABC-2 type transport system permease protein